MLRVIKVITLALQFIIRIRFPADKSLPDIIRQRYGIPILKLLRKAEQLDFKLEKAKLDLDFLSHCKDFGLVPHFLQFKIASPHLRNSTAYSTSQSSLLQAEIHEKNSRIRILW